MKIGEVVGRVILAIFFIVPIYFLVFYLPALGLVVAVVLGVSLVWTLVEQQIGNKQLGSLKLKFSYLARVSKEAIGYIFALLTLGWLGGVVLISVFDSLQTSSTTDRLLFGILFALSMILLKRYG